MNCFLLRLSDNLIILFRFSLYLLYFSVRMIKNILIIDNYDSFTENLRHLLIRVRPEYDFTVIRNNNRILFSRTWDGLIISPGPKGPAETGLLKEFFETVVLPEKIPLLGVCLGMQFLGWYYGLTVRPTEDIRHGRTVAITVENDDLFRELGSQINVMRYNSLAIMESIEQIESQTPLIVTAVQKNTSMIMALKHKSLPFSAVQFHPESFLTEKSELMMANFFEDYIDD